jgi:hypothetical protein
MMPIGDLNLLKEIKRASGSLVVRRRKGRASMKKMYITRIPGFQSTMTAAVFQGDGAEEVRFELYIESECCLHCSSQQWRAEISRYSDIR